VLDARELARRAQARAVARIVVVSVAIVAVALLVVAGAQAFVAERQLRIDNLEQQLTTAVARSQTLQLSRAELSSPSRVLAVAEHTLKMVAPGSVRYLRPVRPGPSVAASTRDLAVPAPAYLADKLGAGLARP
jgi:cell division protein FtsL